MAEEKLGEIPVQKQDNTTLAFLEAARQKSEHMANLGKPEMTAIVSKKDRLTGKVIEEPHRIKLQPSSVEEMFGGPEGEASDEFISAVTKFGHEHPELQDKYPDFDSLAQYYMERFGVGPNGEKLFLKEKIEPIRRMTKTIEPMRHENIEPIKPETPSPERVETAEFLQRLLNRR